MPFTTDAVDGKRDLKTFVRFPLSLYDGNPFFVPPLISERIKFFGPHNPLFNFTEVVYFLTRDSDGRIVGRATAHINRRHNELAGERTGFFGFFECAENPLIAASLMRAVEDWHRERGMDKVRGPYSFSTNEECGFLAEGFDRAPGFMMPYTLPHYLDYMSQLGYTVARDLLAYEYTGSMPEHLTRVSERIRQRTGVIVRPIDKKRFKEDVGTAFDVYNAAWEKNWGFIPMTKEEFYFAADDLKSVMDPSLVLLAEKDGEPIGFSLTLPDHNIVLKKMNGRLLPFGFLHFMFGKRSIHHARVLALGVLQEYRRLGIDILLYHDTFRNGLERGYRSCEMSWILDDNVLMRRAVERMGARVTKVYRIFEKSL